MKCRRTTGGGRRDHPTERTLRRFVQGTTSAAENRAIVAHFLRRCEPCSRVLAALGAMAGLEHR
jgi:hypothetical protein